VCSSDLLKEEILLKFPVVDLICGPDSYRQLPDLIERQLGAPPGSFAFLRTPLSEGLSLETPTDQ